MPLIQPSGHAHPPFCVEQTAAAHGRGFQFRLHALNADASFGQALRYLMEYTRMIGTDEIQDQNLAIDRLGLARSLFDQVETVVAKRRQGAFQRCCLIVGHRNPGNARELLRQMRHPALKPVAAALGNGLGDPLDLTRFVGRDETQH